MIKMCLIIYSVLQNVKDFRHVFHNHLFLDNPASPSHSKYTWKKNTRDLIWKHVKTKGFPVIITFDILKSFKILIFGPTFHTSFLGENSPRIIHKTDLDLFEAVGRKKKRGRGLVKNAFHSVKRTQIRAIFDQIPARFGTGSRSGPCRILLD
jgi:hypothetical protein